MKFIIGKKIEMSQIFSETGDMVPVTRIVAEPCFVTGKKDLEHDGYLAVQVAAGSMKKANKPLAGFFKKIFKADKFFKKVVEFRLLNGEKNLPAVEVGQEFDVSMFAPGDMVNVQAKSKGRGFQGVVRRHHFKGGHKTHGNKDQLRMPGSSGATHPNHVFKGIRKPGHMGDAWCTISGLSVVSVDPAKNELWVKGSVPGGRNSLLYVYGQGEFSAKPSVKVETAPAAETPVVEAPVTENTAV